MTVLQTFVMGTVRKTHVEEKECCLTLTLTGMQSRVCQAGLWRVESEVTGSFPVGWGSQGMSPGISTEYRLAVWQHAEWAFADMLTLWKHTVL